MTNLNLSITAGCDMFRYSEHNVKISAYIKDPIVLAQPELIESN